jgi:hypothetical protein
VVAEEVAEEGGSYYRSRGYSGRDWTKFVYYHHGRICCGDEKSGVDRVSQNGFYFYADAYNRGFGSYSCYHNYGCGYAIDGDCGCDPYHHLSSRIVCLDHRLFHRACAEHYYHGHHSFHNETIDHH